MSDPEYVAVPPGGYSEDEGICPVCHGILPGYTGIEGEWPCECDKVDQMIDADIEARRLRRKR
jgi:hypothetical protein